VAKAADGTPVILGGDSHRATLEAASSALAAFLTAFCLRVSRGLRAERREIGAWIRIQRAEREPLEALVANRSEFSGVLRRLTRISRRPEPEARRQARLLCRLLRQGTFAAAAVSADRVEARVGPAERRRGSFTVVLTADDARFFPVLIRRDSQVAPETLGRRAGADRHRGGESRPREPTAACALLGQRELFGTHDGGRLRGDIRVTHRFLAGPVHASRDSVLAARRLLWLAARSLEGHATDATTETPRDVSGWDSLPVPPISRSVERFLPTVLCMKTVPWGSRRGISRDVDHGFRPRFITAVHVKNDTRSTPTGQAVQHLAEAYLAPPALPFEAAERSALLASSGKGVPLGAGERLRRGVGPSMLTRIERRRLEFLSLDERVALEAVLAAREGLAVAFSHDGRWPGGGLLIELAERLGCRIVRRSLSELPRPILERLEWVCYEVVSPASYRERGT